MKGSQSYHVRSYHLATHAGLWYDLPKWKLIGPNALIASRFTVPICNALWAISTSRSSPVTSLGTPPMESRACWFFVGYRRNCVNPKLAIQSSKNSPALSSSVPNTDTTPTSSPHITSRWQPGGQGMNQFPKGTIDPRSWAQGLGTAFKSTGSEWRMCVTVTACNCLICFVFFLHKFFENETWRKGTNNSLYHLNKRGEGESFVACQSREACCFDLGFARASRNSMAAGNLAQGKENMSSTGNSWKGSQTVWAHIHEVHLQWSHDSLLKRQALKSSMIWASGKAWQIFYCSWNGKNWCSWHSTTFGAPNARVKIATPVDSSKETAIEVQCKCLTGLGQDVKILAVVTLDCSLHSYWMLLAYQNERWGMRDWVMNSWGIQEHNVQASTRILRVIWNCWKRSTSRDG